MNNDAALLLLAARRQRLIAQAEGQRGQLAVAAAPWAVAWRRVERGLMLWQRWRSAAWIAVLPAAALLLLRPRAAGRAATRLWALWRGARSLRRRLEGRGRP